MQTKTKVWLVLATCLVLMGLIIFGGTLSMANWDFSNLSTRKYQTNNYEINQKFTGITINSNTADIIFLVSDSEETYVECFEEQNAKHLVQVKDNCLSIEIDDLRKWYEYIGLSFKTSKITIHIPEGEYGSLLIKSSTSDIEIPNELKFNNIDISVSTGNVRNCASSTGDLKLSTSTGHIDITGISAGKIELSTSTGDINASSVVCSDDFFVNVTTGKTNISDTICKSIFSKGNTGKVALKNVIVSETFDIKRSTGDILIDKCDAKELNITTDTGDVKGTLLSEKVFITKTDTGRVNVPKTVSGGKCEITTDTGNIKINIE